MMGPLFWIFVTFILYVYAGYPALLTVFARLRNRKPTVAPITPPLTLLIAAYNEEQTIGAKLKNSLQLDYPAEKLQILVAADGSDDRTTDIVREFAADGVELSYSPARKGKMAAINRAMPLTKGDIVVFSDANNMYQKDTLSEIVKPFSDPAVGATTGAKLIMEGDGSLGSSEGLYWRYESYIKSMETLVGSVTGVVGELFAIRRDLFESPPDTVINDDYYMAMSFLRRGHRIVYVPSARSLERVSVSARDEVARRSRIVAGRYQSLRLLPLDRPVLVWQILSHKLFRPLVSLAMVGALVTNLLAVVLPVPDKPDSLLYLTPPFGALLLSLQALFYLLAWLGSTVPLGGRLGRVLYLPAFLVNSNRAAFVGLLRIARREQSTLWQKVGRREEADSPGDESR